MLKKRTQAALERIEISKKKETNQLAGKAAATKKPNDRRIRMGGSAWRSALFYNFFR